MMKPWMAADKNKLDTLVILAGDCDFSDMINYLRKERNKMVYVIGYRENTSYRMSETAGPKFRIYLDEIWNQISEPRSESSARPM